MASGIGLDPEARPAVSRRRDLVISGILMVTGLLINVAFTVLHPAGREDDHSEIFADYAASDSWVLVHLGQFVGVTCALAGLLVLYRLLATGRSRLLAQLGTAAVVATTATWAVVQGLDGVGLKQAVDAWTAASGAQRQILFGDAETIRWLEWGFQSYFRLLLGISFALAGAAILMGRHVTGWLGWTAVMGGLCSLLIGVDVGYSGLASGLQDVLGIAFLVLVLVFAVGVLVTGSRKRESRAG